jgi:hypothetical protein
LAVTWGGSTGAFAAQGVLAAILSRLPAAQTAATMAAFAELREAERGAGPALAQPRTSLGGGFDG